MTWWEDQGLIAGQLAGVEIIVEEVTDQLGRRLVMPLLPGSDRRPPAIDLGRNEAPWQVTAYVTGSYLPAYRRIRAILDAQGPYTFSHPYLGDYLVDLPDGIEIRQSMAQGGIAYLSFTAVPASDVLPFSEPIASPRDQVRSKAVAAATLIEEGFPTRYPGTPVLTSIDLATGWIEGIADRIDDAARRARSFATPVTDLADAVTDLRSRASTLANLPAELARTVSSLLASVFAFFTGEDAEAPEADPRVSKSAARDTLDALTRWEAYPPEDRQGLPSPTLLAYAAAFEALLGGLALAQFQLVMRELPLESTVEAEAITETVLAVADKFLFAPGLDEKTEQALQDLRTTWSTYVLAAVLPEVQELLLPVERSAIVLAMELYGDPERGEEIAELNGILESSFLPAGRPLQVLTR